MLLRRHELVELTEHRVHGGFHGGADSREGQHWLDGFTNLAISGRRASPTVFCTGAGSAAMAGPRAPILVVISCSFGTAAAALASSVIEATVSVAFRINPVALLISPVLSPAVEPLRWLCLSQPVRCRKACCTS